MAIHTSLTEGSGVAGLAVSTLRKSGPIMEDISYLTFLFPAGDKVLHEVMPKRRLLPATLLLFQ